MKGQYLITSESVGKGHPDKVCDQISDAVLDCVLKDDPRGRVACETFITAGLVIVGGEITTTTYIDVHNLVRRVLKVSIGGSRYRTTCLRRGNRTPCFSGTAIEYSCRRCRFSSIVSNTPSPVSEIPAGSNKNT